MHVRQCDQCGNLITSSDEYFELEYVNPQPTLADHPDYMVDLCSKQCLIDFLDKEGSE